MKSDSESCFFETIWGGPDNLLGVAEVCGVDPLALKVTQLLAPRSHAEDLLSEVLDPDVKAHLEPGVVDLATLHTPEEGAMQAKYFLLYCT